MSVFLSRPAADPGFQEAGMKLHAKKTNRGSAIVMVVVFASILTSIGMSVMYMNSSEEIAERVDVDRTRALYFAEAGMERATNWMQNCIQWPETMMVGKGSTAAFNPFNGTVVVDAVSPANQGTYTVQIDPDDDNDKLFEKKYLITSTGKAGNFEKVIVSSVTLRNACSYAYFSDREIDQANATILGAAGTRAANHTTQRIYFSDNDSFYGQVHSNDYMSFVSRPNVYEISGVRIIPAIFESTSTHRSLYEGQEFSATTTTPAPFDLDPDTFTLNAQRVNVFGKWQERLERIKIFANSDPHVGYTPIAAGPVVLQIRQTAVWKQIGSSTYVKVCDAATGKGCVIYVNGDVSLSSGKDVAGKIYDFQRNLTIVSTGVITITGNINVKDNGVKKGTIGLAAPRIEISDSIDTSVEIDAALMTEMLAVPSFSTKSAQTLTIEGAVLHKYRYPVGMVTDTSVSKYGFAHKYKFDERLVDELPYYFPTYFMLKQNIRHEKATKNL
jgi:hypothetical protein